MRPLLRLAALASITTAMVAAIAAAAVATFAALTAITTLVAASSAATTAGAPVVVVMMENHGYWGTVGNVNMPYFNGLWQQGKAKTGPVLDFTAMYAVTHPSLPNYLAITGGSTQGQAGSDSVYAGKFAATSLWDQLSAAGVSWGVYQEGMPAACSPAGSYADTATDGPYVLRHNPATVYKPVYTSAECQQVQPLSALDVTALPAVSFITPNICDDQHGIPSTQPDPYASCVAASAALAQRGDTWLSALIPRLTGAGADVILTWDEGGGTAGVNGTAGGGRLGALETGPGVTAGQSATGFSHYSVLAALEDRAGVARLGNAARAAAIPLPAPAPATATPSRPTRPHPTATLTSTGHADGGAQPVMAKPPSMVSSTLTVGHR